jgi:hypothetical protein
MTRRIKTRKPKSGQSNPITRDKLLSGVDYIVVSGGGSLKSAFSVQKRDPDDSRLVVERPKILASISRERTTSRSW